MRAEKSKRNYGTYWAPYNTDLQNILIYVTKAVRLYQNEVTSSLAVYVGVVSLL